MIAQLTGQLAHRSPEYIIIDIGGVGYRLQVPLSTYYALPENGQVKLHVHTHVKEDAINLFGFSSDSEKNLFVLLLSVSGVGPKLAITTLSHIPSDELALALCQGDIPRLTAIPGIGKKSAERLVLELQDKAAKFAIEGTVITNKTPQTAEEESHQDALSALINLGYKENLAKRALGSLKISPGTPLEEVLKAALKILLK